MRQRAGVHLHVSRLVVPAQRGLPLGAPMRRDFQEATLKDRNRAWRGCPVFGNYRGFVFASLSPDVLPLLEYLGEARRGIDELVDRSPEGEIEFWPAAIAMNTTATGSSSSKTWPICTSTIRRRVTPRRSGPTAVSSHAARQRRQRAVLRRQWRADSCPDRRARFQQRPQLPRLRCSAKSRPAASGTTTAR